MLCFVIILTVIVSFYVGFVLCLDTMMSDNVIADRVYKNKSLHWLLRFWIHRNPDK